MIVEKEENQQQQQLSICIYMYVEIERAVLIMQLPTLSTVHTYIHLHTRDNNLTY